MITQPTLVLVMMAAMVMLDYMVEGVVQEGVVWEWKTKPWVSVL